MTYNPHIPVTDGLVLAVIPAAASLLDHSGLGHVLTTTGDWARRNGVYGYDGGASGTITTPHAADLSVSAYSCFVAGVFSPDNAGAFFYKLGAGGRMQFYTTGAGGSSLATFDGATGSSLVLDINRARSVGVSQAGGAKPDFVVDGVVRGQGNAVITVPVTNQQMLLLGTGVPTIIPHGKAFLFYNETKTADEWARLHAWSESLTSPLLSHDRRYFLMGSQVPRGDANGEVGSWDFRDLTAGVVPDRSGNGNDGTMNAVHTARTEMGPAAHSYGAGGAAADGVTLAGPGGTDDITFECLVYPRSAGEGNAGRLIEIGSISNYIYLGAVPVTTPIWSLAGITGSPFVASGAIRANEWFHMVFTRRRSDGAVRIYVNGEAALSTTGGTEAFDYTGVSTLFNRATGSRATDVDVPYCQLYNRYMEADEVKNRYLPIRRKLLYQLDLSQVPPTTADVTAGQVIPGTDNTVDSGTWAVVEESDGEKHVECVVAGDTHRPWTQAFGSWRERCFRPIDNSTLIFNLMGTMPTWNDTGNDGYILRHRLNSQEFALVRVTNGGAIAFVGSSFLGLPAASVYDFHVTRTTESVWTVWVKGGTYLVWTALVTGTDATYVTSRFKSISASVGDWVTLGESQYQGVIAP